MPYAVILETDRLFLRRLTPDDAPLICDLDSDPEVMRYISKGQPTPLEKIENEVLPRWLRLYEKHEHLGFFAAHEKASGDFIGWLCLQPDRYIPEIEIGYRLKRHVWGRGYATEGSKALVEKAFTAWGLDRITSHTLAVNKASQRVMEKCGLCFQHSFTYEESLLSGWTEEERQGVRYGLSKGDYLRMKEGGSV